MGGILGGLSDLLFGKVEVPEMDYDELAKLLKLGIQENRYDQNGLFTSQNWDEGKHAMTQSVNPGIQPGYEAMQGRVNQGTPGYEGAGRFKELLAAYEARGPRERRPRPDIPDRPPNFRPPSSYPGGG